MSDPIGYKFKCYEILELIGVGGLGKVYSARDTRDGSIVAIKFLHEKFQKSRKLLGLFHREMMIVSSLHHKHIVSYRDSQFAPPNCFIVTDFIYGWPTSHLIKKVGKVPPIVAISILIDMLQGIDYLHLHDVIHSDLSAANILINREGRVYVADFGLSFRSEIEDYRDSVIGTPGYFSPEHVTRNPIVPATDLYCASLLLYEYLTGKKAVPPTGGRQEIIKSMKKIDFKVSFANDKAVNKSLKNILKKGLEFSSSKRIGSAEELIYEVYKAGKKFGLVYPRHAILEFLTDRRLSPPPFRGKAQNIYLGFTGE